MVLGVISNLLLIDFQQICFDHQHNQSKLSNRDVAASLHFELATLATGTEPFDFKKKKKRKTYAGNLPKNKLVTF